MRRACTALGAAITAALAGCATHAHVEERRATDYFMVERAPLPDDYIAGLALWQVSEHTVVRRTNLVVHYNNGMFGTWFPVEAPGVYLQEAECPGLAAEFEALRQTIVPTAQLLVANPPPGDELSIYSHAPTFTVQYRPGNLLSSEIRLKAYLDEVPWWWPAWTIYGHVEQCLAAKTGKPVKE
jgi:hypothetical protein